MKRAGGDVRRSGMSGAEESLRRKCCGLRQMLELEFKAWKAFEHCDGYHKHVPVEIHQLCRQFETEHEIRRFCKNNDKSEQAQHVWVRFVHEGLQYYWKQGESVGIDIPPDDHFVSTPESVRNNLDDLRTHVHAHYSLAGQLATRSLQLQGRQGATQRRPGQMPWSTFFYSSSVLVVVWLVGCCYYTLAPVMGWGGHGKLEEVTTLENAQQVFSLSRWHQRPAPLKTVSLASHPALGSAVLVAERYGVHVVHLNTTSASGSSATAYLSTSAKLVADVEICLAAVPSFHSDGIAGIQVECDQSNSRCFALLLRHSGRDVLRCELKELLSYKASHEASAAPELLSLKFPRFAQGWHMLSVATTRSAAAGLWVTDDAQVKSPVHLRLHRHASLTRKDRRVRTGSNDGVHKTTEVTLLDVLPRQSRLSIWRVNPGPTEPFNFQSVRPTTWRLPTEKHWVAACAGDDHILVATTAGEVWRFSMPGHTTTPKFLLK